MNHKKKSYETHLRDMQKVHPKHLRMTVVKSILAGFKMSVGRAKQHKSQELLFQDKVSGYFLCTLTLMLLTEKYYYFCRCQLLLLVFDSDSSWPETDGRFY